MFHHQEYLAAAYLKKICLIHGEADGLLSGDEIGDFLNRTNVKNFVVGDKLI